MPTPSHWAALLALAGLAAGSPSSGAAQEPTTRTTRDVYATRAELEDLLSVFNGAAESPAYSDSLRARAQSEARSIRTRLDQGDFQVGDRVAMSVEGTGALEQSLSDTFVVRDARLLQLPTIGSVQLTGVLRAELEQHMRQYVERYIREPSLHVRSLIRISIDGAVGRPGFYSVPTDALLTDALMFAGGPVARARINEIEVDRGGRRMLGGQVMQEAIREGRTIDQLDLRAGDRILVPQGGGGIGSAEGAVRTLTLALSIPFTILALARVF